MSTTTLSNALTDAAGRTLVSGGSIAVGYSNSTTSNGQYEREQMQRYHDMLMRRQLDAMNAASTPAMYMGSAEAKQVSVTPVVNPVLLLL